MNRIRVNDNLAALWCEFSECNPSQFKQEPSGHCLLAVVVFIQHENNSFIPAWMMTGFITWKQGNIHTAALYVSRILVHDGVQLAMVHIRIFSIRLIFFCSSPRQQVIAAPIWDSIVPDPNHLAFCIHDAGSHLGTWVLASLCQQKGSCHEILQSPQIVIPFLFARNVTHVVCRSHMPHLLRLGADYILTVRPTLPPLCAGRKSRKNFYVLVFNDVFILHRDQPIRELTLTSKIPS